MHTKLPFKIFVGLCLAFFVAHGMFNVIAHHYTWVHFYFGVSAPLFVGYFPYTLFRWNGWSQVPVNRNWCFGWRWSLLAGVIGTFLASFINEVVGDPKQNGVPFFEAWHHFAADMVGIAVFAVVYFVVFRRLFSRPNPPLNSDAPTSGAPVSSTLGRNLMSTDATPASQAITCPTCLGANVRRKRTRKSALVWLGLFVAFIVLAAVTPYPSPPSLVFGMGAWVFLLVAIGVAIHARFAMNRCKDCKQKWR